jgi:2'-5' RNA ligase
VWTMRLFVAIELPDTTRQDLALLMNGLPGAKWTAPENLHVTLRFVGEVDGREAQDLDDALSAIRAPAFTLSLAGIGKFGEGRNSRSLWVGVEPNPALVHLRDKVESAAVRAGQPPERRKFKPHVSLARFKGVSGPRMQDYLARHGLYRASPFEVRQFTLFSSFLSHNGAIHRPEASYELVRPALAAG